MGHATSQPEVIVQIVLDRPTAEILPFAPRRAQGNRLTMMDRIHAAEWDVTRAAPVGASVVIHARQAHDAPEIGDYIGIYRADDRWAVWGAAREGQLITIWHGPTGTDLGSFADMRRALSAVRLDSIQRRVARSL